MTRLGGGSGFVGYGNGGITGNFNLVGAVCIGGQGLIPGFNFIHFLTLRRSYFKADLSIFQILLPISTICGGLVCNLAFSFHKGQAVFFRDEGIGDGFFVEVILDRVVFTSKIYFILGFAYFFKTILVKFSVGIHFRQGKDCLAGHSLVPGGHKGNTIFFIRTSEQTWLVCPNLSVDLGC